MRVSPGAIVETDIPSRLDRLPWGRFHTLVVVALGITWFLDGLQVMFAAAVVAAIWAVPAERKQSRFPTAGSAPYGQKATGKL